MKIRIQRSLINSVPSVIVYTTDWSREELDCMLRLGEPFVNLGGVFWKTPCHVDDSNDCPCVEALEDSNDGYCESDDCFVMPEAMKRIRSDFPVLQQFPEDRFENPELVAKIWADEIARRIAVEVKDIRYNGTMFSKEETYEV